MLNVSRTHRYLCAFGLAALAIACGGNASMTGSDAPAAAPGTPGATIRGTVLGAAAAGDVIVAAGTGVALGDWTLACAPHAIALVVDGAGLAPVQDRLRELSGQGRRRVRLAATSDAPVDLDPLPHWRMAT